MQYFEQSGNSLLFRENGETVKITPWGMNSLRVQGSFLGEIPEENAALLEPEGNTVLPEPVRSAAVPEREENTVHPEQKGNTVPPEPEGNAARPMPEEACTAGPDEGRKRLEGSVILIDASGMSASVTNGGITAECLVQPWGSALQITFKNAEGKVLLQEISNGGALTLKAREYKPLPGGSFRLKASFIADPHEKIYGMGQYQQERMDLKGCNLELAHRNSQASVPFYVSSRGYGFLWNNAAIGEVHFGLNTTEWIAESTKGLDYWITAGENPAQIEEQFAEAAGKAPMMPEYGLGFWQCKLRYYNQEQVLEIARGYKERGITPDVLVIDYYHWPRCGDWRFDEEYFPDPKAMVEELHRLGIETMVSFWPQVDWRSENYEEMKQQGLLVRNNTGIDIQMLFHGNNVFMDATNPRTREYVWKKVKENYGNLGIRTFWLDEAEPEFTGYSFDHYRYAAGPVAETGNIYPREYARLFYEGQKADGRDDIVSLIRCAWVGSQRYGALVWSGDIMSTYEDFRKQICAGIHMGLAGIPWWTTDIGGFHNGWNEKPEFRELLVRWFEFGCFCPVMRLHGCRQPGEQIINKAGEVREWTGAGNEIWTWGPEIEKILTGYIHVREQMRPYTRSIMREAHEKGSPVIRALFYEFPGDEKAWDITDEYLFGPDLLIAPVCHEGARARSIYLPEGASWTDAWTGEEYAGGQSIGLDVPLNRIPVFARNGAQKEICAALRRELG